MGNEKKWYKSKTIWINVLIVIVGVATALADHIAAGGSLTFMGLVNILLRVITKTQLKFY